ncbi:hypothetical protein GYH30_037608 [Glycine max]|nr:hypothetical protein GYH30_037608 [Glycine max]
MCLVTEMVMVVIGLWGVFLRPMMFQHAAEMGVVIGCTIYGLIRERPSWILSNYYFPS